MKLLVSACLLGLCCRYDGAGKPNPAVQALAQRHTLIPFCPEIYGGLPTPREPAEIAAGRVKTKSGLDVTAAYEKGAREALALAKQLGCDGAVLQDRSPSCGVGVIHDGSFAGGLTEGDGLTAELLQSEGLRVWPASRAAELTTCPCTRRCDRYGDCAACRAHHKRRPPRCESKGLPSKTEPSA